MDKEPEIVDAEVVQEAESVSPNIVEMPAQQTTINKENPYVEDVEFEEVIEEPAKEDAAKKELSPEEKKAEKKKEAQEMLGFVQSMANSTENPELAAAAKRIMADGQARAAKNNVAQGEDGEQFFQTEALRVALGFHNPDLPEEPTEARGAEAKLLREAFKEASEKGQTFEYVPSQKDEAAPVLDDKKAEKKKEAQDMLGFVQEMANSTENPELAAAATRVMEDAKKRMEKNNVSAGEDGEQFFQTEAVRITLGYHNPDLPEEPTEQKGKDAKLLRDGFKAFTEARKAEQEMGTSLPARIDEPQIEAESSLPAVVPQQEGQTAAPAHQSEQDSERQEFENNFNKVAEFVKNKYNLDLMSAASSLSREDMMRYIQEYQDSLTQEEEHGNELPAAGTGINRDNPDIEDAVFEDVVEAPDAGQLQLPAHEEEPARDEDVPVQAPEENTEVVGSFGAAVEDDRVYEDENLSLYEQALRTQLKINYQAEEFGLDHEPEEFPYSRVKSLEDNSKDPENPYVMLEFESGSKLYNRPNQIDMRYSRRLSSDGTEVDTSTLTFEDCMAAVRLGQQKGWTAATIDGPDEYKEQMYLACRAAGMKTLGYTPSKELQELGDALEKQHNPTRDHAKSVDDRFSALEGERLARGLEPEDIDKNFADSMRQAGLGYNPDGLDQRAPQQQQTEAPAPVKPEKETEAPAPVKPELQTEAQTPVKPDLQAEGPVQQQQAQLQLPPAQQESSENQSLQTTLSSTQLQLEGTAENQVQSEGKNKSEKPKGETSLVAVPTKTGKERAAFAQQLAKEANVSSEGGPAMTLQRVGEAKNEAKGNQVKNAVMVKGQVQQKLLTSGKEN